MDSGTCVAPSGAFCRWHYGAPIVALLVGANADAGSRYLHLYHR